MTNRAAKWLVLASVLATAMLLGLMVLYNRVHKNDVDRAMRETVEQIKCEQRQMLEVELHEREQQ